LLVAYDQDGFTIGVASRSDLRGSDSATLTFQGNACGSVCFVSVRDQLNRGGVSFGYVLTITSP
ncbi:MAG: hypothetical protein HY335_08795, partial [Deinococcus sp.]|nr:hypothetical protein [Deinococcus sp.]